MRTNSQAHGTEPAHRPSPERVQMLRDQEAARRAWRERYAGAYPPDPDSIADGEATDLIVPDEVRAELDQELDAIRITYTNAYHDRIKAM
ncbi:hypothetical protein LO763_22895 [Glycomyces sp. A-F 0318]|uniref:hypothetical protein n=1 Tax=Glycomyces amatae TaxID=2881355 RepID=UPI001E40B64C|nr:hypothetical protein [Glycomyces amatae]MCD0446468.1 hypothetical protein [Glycomyces amatae]